MRQISFIFIYILYFALVADCALFRERLEERSGHKNQCYFKSSNKTTKYFFVGSYAYNEPKCLRYSCSKQDAKLYLEGAGCGAIGVVPPCILTAQTVGRYPDCCPLINCP